MQTHMCVHAYIDFQKHIYTYIYTCKKPLTYVYAYIYTCKKPLTYVYAYVHTITYIHVIQT